MSLDDNVHHTIAGKFINWLTIADQAASVKEDVDRIVGHPLVNKSIPVHGYVYDVKSGKLNHIYSAGGKA
jgi:carbonic anhydrase